MHPDLQMLFYKAEDHFLQPLEMKLFRHHMGSLKQRLETYELLREQELDVFQAIADNLEAAFAQGETAQLEQALRHWITVFRYAAMAMLLNNPEYLQRHLLEWFTEVDQTRQLRTIEAQVCQQLHQQLGQRLSPTQLALIEPPLALAENALLGAPVVQLS